MNKEQLKAHLKTLTDGATDTVAKLVPEMYPIWVAVIIKDGKEHKAKYKKGGRVRHNDKLYNVLKNHNVKDASETPDVTTDIYQEVV